MERVRFLLGDGQSAAVSVEPVFECFGEEEQGLGRHWACRTVLADMEEPSSSGRGDRERSDYTARRLARALTKICSRR